MRSHEDCTRALALVLVAGRRLPSRPAAAARRRRQRHGRRSRSTTARCTRRTCPTGRASARSARWTSCRSRPPGHGRRRAPAPQRLRRGGARSLLPLADGPDRPLRPCRARTRWGWTTSPSTRTRRAGRSSRAARWWRSRPSGGSCSACAASRVTRRQLERTIRTRRAASRSTSGASTTCTPSTRPTSSSSTSTSSASRCGRAITSPPSTRPSSWRRSRSTCSRCARRSSSPASGIASVAQGGARPRSQAARQRLLFWDMRREDIAALERRGKVQRTVDLHAERLRRS